MNLFQLSKKYMENGWDGEDGILAGFMTGVGLDVIQHIFSDFEFETGDKHQSMCFFWKAISAHYEWGKTGVRKDLTLQEEIPWNIEYAPLWFYKKEKIRMKNGFCITKDNQMQQSLSSFNLVKDAENCSGMSAGIRAGLWLYDSLCQSYVLAYQTESKKAQQLSFVDFTACAGQGEHYELRQWNIYAYLARCLIILRQTKEALIEGEGDGTNLMQQDPILGLLLICEAMNPINTCNMTKEQEKNLLEKIQFCWVNNALIFRLPKSFRSFGTYSKQIMDLLPQLGIHVSVDSQLRQVSFCF